MLSLEQVELLYEKVENAVQYIQRLNDENVALREKLDANQKRVDELEVLVTLFKEEQGRIEDGILAALDRLNAFENAIEKSLALRGVEKPASKPEAKKPAKEKPLIKERDIETEEPETDIEMDDIPDPVIEETREESSEPINGELDIF